MYQNLKTLRTSLSMTQEEFGSSVGVAKTTYSNYEQGVREPKSDFLIAVADKYNVTIDYLMGRSDDPHGLYKESKESDSKHTKSSSMCTEAEVAKKYRALDEHGKRIVSMVLDEEYNRVQQHDFHLIKSAARGQGKQSVYDEHADELAHDLYQLPDTDEDI